MIYITIRMSIYSTETILYSPMSKINHQGLNFATRAVTGVIKIYINLSEILNIIPPENSNSSIIILILFNIHKAVAFY